MDISTTTQHKPKQHKYIWLTAGLMTVALLVFWLNSPSIPTLRTAELETATVQQGPLDIKIPVLGEYASRYERLISAPETAQVTESFLRAGAEVTATSIIAKLSNPDLDQQLFESQSQLERMHSEFAAFKLQKQNEQLNFQAELADMQSQIQAAQLDVDVNQRLAQQGIAAKIELERAELRLSQLQKRLQFAQYRFEKQQEMHKLELEQQQIQLNQQQKQVTLIADKVANLTVTAGIEGTLQQLDIELGQRVSQGQAMARVGSKSQLMARINIPQRLAERVKLGAQVNLKHPQGAFSGTVQQLGSVVENGFIIAEVHFTEGAPANLRPAQPVNALVFLEHLENALYIAQRPGLSPLGTQPLYKKTAQQAQLTQTQVRFGELSEQYLLIHSGLKVGDIVITSDLSQWHNFSQLALDNDKL